MKLGGVGYIGVATTSMVVAGVAALIVVQSIATERARQLAKGTGAICGIRGEAIFVKPALLHSGGTFDLPCPIAFCPDAQRAKLVQCVTRNLEAKGYRYKPHACFGSCGGAVE